MNPDADARSAAVETDRARLVSIAFRMLGTLADAEDAVQDTYVRWYRMSREDRDAVEVPAAWLTRALGRVCLNLLDSAHRKRELYTGPWLPEPVPVGAFTDMPSAAGDPLDRMTVDESVSSALLLLLESMTPAERVAFVLHDIFAVPFDEIAAIVGRSSAACRQLATAGRRRLNLSRAQHVTGPEHDQVVRAFTAAARRGDLAALIAVLDPRVEVRSDGGGFVTAARRPIAGAENVARFLLGALHKYPTTTIEQLETTDGLGFALRREGRIVGVATIHVTGRVVTAIHLVMNPHKLTLWNTEGPSRSAARPEYDA